VTHPSFVLTPDAGQQFGSLLIRFHLQQSSINTAALALRF
jgi:hypothetical protein